MTPDLAKPGTPPLGGHDGDDPDLAHEHCHCGWCLPCETVPVHAHKLPERDGFIPSEHAIPGVSVALICPRCGEGHLIVFDLQPAGEN